MDAEAKAVGRYLTAQPDGKGWTIRMTNGGGNLGLVRWSLTWKRWVFQPFNETEFSDDCLQALSKFLAHA